MSATVICLSSPADLLSAVPHLLGFYPDQSLVVMCLTGPGKGSRLGMVARVDLPGEGRAADAVDALLPALAREDPDAAVVIAYGTDEHDGLVAVEVLSAALTEVGVQVRDRLLVVKQRWRSLGWPDRQAWAGVPGPDAPPALEFAVAAGSAPAANRAELTRRCAAGPRAGAVGRECARLARTDGEVTIARGAAAWGRLLSSRAGERADMGRLTDATVALAAASLHAGGSPALRDALAGWLTPGVLALHEMRPDALTGLREHLPLPWRDDPPGTTEPADTAWLVDRLIDVAGCLPDDHAVPVLTVLAHVAWQQGNGAVARVALDRARAADPGYFLAALLDRVVTEGMRPRAM